MTLPAQYPYVKTAGNGAQTVFAYSFEIPYQDDGVSPAVAVYVVLGSAAPVVVSPSLYTITGVGNQGGGTVVYPLTGSPLTSADALIVIRNMALTQAEAFPDTPFDPAQIEAGLDRLALQIQQVAIGAAPAAGIVSGVASFNARTGAITLLASDIQGALGGDPLLKSGGQMTGKLLTAASAAVAGAGFGLPPGIAPNSPANGDLWTTSASVFARVGGVTHDLLADSNLVSITQYGAVCDGVTNDTAAWNAAIADINAGVIENLFIPGPSGVVGALNPITTVAYKGLFLTGAGYGSGPVHLSGGDVTMLSITTPHNSSRVLITNMAFRTKQANLGQALYLGYGHDYNYSGETNVSMENVMVTGWDAPQAQLNGWNRGIETYNIRSGSYINVNVFGYVTNAAFPANVLNSLWAWNCHSDTGSTPGHWSINCRFLSCDVSWFQTAWIGRNHLEGYSWVTCCPAFVGTAWDIAITGTTTAPYFEWVNCQTEFFNNGFLVDECSYINIVSCQIFCNNALNTTRTAISISNSVSAFVHHNEFICGDSLGVTNMITLTNVQEGKTEGNNLRGFAGTGIVFTGTTVQCITLNDRIISPYLSATLYLNNSSQATGNQRRGMIIVNPAGTPGVQDNQSSVGAFLGGGTAVATNLTLGQISMPFRVQVGDQLRVSVVSYVSRDAADARVTTRWREYTHRPGSANPFTVVKLAGDFGAAGQNNFANNNNLTAIANEGYTYNTVVFDVVATANDAVFNLDVFTDPVVGTQLAFIGNDYVKIERV